MPLKTILDRSTIQIMGRGALVVLEGCDRAGKSTQVKMLIKSLRELGIPTEARQFPNRRIIEDRDRSWCNVGVSVVWAVDGTEDVNVKRKIQPGNVNVTGDSVLFPRTKMTVKFVREVLERLAMHFINCHKYGMHPIPKICERSTDEKFGNVTTNVLISHEQHRGTEIGAVINEYLTSKKDYPPETIHLLFSANRWECREEMERMLKNGTTLILDRYAASGAAYGAENTGRDLAWCKKPDKGLPAPDLVAYLRIDGETQKSQCGWAEERYEKAEFQKKVAQNFAELSDETWKIIERDDVHKTHSTILEAVMSIVQAVKDRPLRRLYES